MPQNDFLPFGLGIGANVLPTATWVADSERVMGFKKGVGESIKANTAWRHCSFITAGVAALIFETLGEDVLDDGDLAKFIRQLRDTLIDVTGGPDAPSDGEYYIRYNGGWVNATGIYLRLTGGTMQGFITLHAFPLADMHAVNKKYVDNIRDALLAYIEGQYLPLAGTDDPRVVPPRMRGFITLHAYPVLEMHAANKGYIDKAIADMWAEIRDPNNGYLKLTGGTMRGYIVLHAAPTQAMHPVNLSYLQTYVGDLLRGYLPLTGGTLYRSGANDILTMDADNGRYSRIRYNVRNTRLWSAGVDTLGHWAIADETAQSYRLRIEGITGRIESWFTGGTGLRLNGPGNQDNYINLVGQTSWLIGPQANQNRLIFFNWDYRFFIYDNGNMHQPSGEWAWFNWNVSVGWDLHIAASAFINGCQLYNLPGQGLYSVQRFVAADFQSFGNCLVNGWVAAGGDIRTPQWVSGGGVHAVGCLRGGHLDIDNYGHFQGGVWVRGYFPGQGYGLGVEQRGAFFQGIDVWGGALMVTNGIWARTWGGVDIYNGLYVTGNTWMNCPQVIIGSAEQYGFGDLWVCHCINIAFAQQICGQVSAPGFMTYSGYNYWSDQRFKGNVEPASNIDALAAICRLKFYQYDQSIDGDSGEAWHEDLGVIAQQVVEAIPEVIVEGEWADDVQKAVVLHDYKRTPRTRDIADRPLSINLISMVHHSLRAIQQLADQNAALIERIEALESERRG